MDCRGTLGLALCLLSSAAGCQHQVATLTDPSQSSVPFQQPPPDASQLKQASKPRKDPPPSVLVKFGDFKAGEAFAPDIPRERQQSIRQAARDEYERALKIDPKYLPAYQGLARLYTATQDHPRAVETYQKALQLAPKNAALWYELGLSHNYAKEYNSSLDCLNRATQLEPENRDYINTLGVVLAQTNHLQESLNCFIRGSGEAMGNYRLARTLERLQQPELSQRYLSAALQLDPNLAAAQTMRGETDGSRTPTIQRTSYQEPSAPLAPPPAPAPAAADVPLPRVIHADAIQTDNRAAPEEFVVPPPPPVILRYDDPTDAVPTKE